MITLYLCCFILGGLLLIISIFSGIDTEVGELEVAGNNIDSGVDGEGVESALKFLSFRNAVYFLTFFGLTGSTLARLEFPGSLAFIAAIVMGLFAAMLGHLAMQYLQTSQVGAGRNPREIVGQTAKVIVGVANDHAGKVSINFEESVHQMLARVAEESSIQIFSPGETVTVVRVQNGFAYVAENTFID